MNLRLQHPLRLVSNRKRIFGIYVRFYFIANDHAKRAIPIELRTISTPPIPKKNKLVSSLIGSFWDSKEAKKVFAPNSPNEKGTNVAFRSYIDLLESFQKDPTIMAKYVNWTNNKEHTIN